MPETTITSADGTKLAARCSGHGSPMVLVHGALGDVDTFALIEGLLAERHSVWVYSRRGRGGSGDGRDYTFEREVDEVLAVLAAAGDRAHLVGHSFGAVCCLLAATRSPSLRSVSRRSTCHEASQPRHASLGDNYGGRITMALRLQVDRAAERGRAGGQGRRGHPERARLVRRLECGCETDWCAQARARSRRDSALAGVR